MRQGILLLLGAFLLCVLPNYAQISASSLEVAFAKDNFDVVKSTTYQGCRGILAEHRTAINYETKQKKRVIYVEGTSYQMGYLIGYLAEPEMEQMTTQFLDRIIFDFIGVDVDPEKIIVIWSLLKGVILGLVQKVKPDVPVEYLQEIEGMVAGAKAADPKTKVNSSDLLMLNVGIDCLLAYIYAFDHIWDRQENSTPNSILYQGKTITLDDLRIPVMCNAFSVFGKATSDGKHYFGRDFMFPTAKTFEFTSCHIIYRPHDGRLPLVSITAPGFAGSIAAMNSWGIGLGVDMSPSGNCNSSRPGLNSLLLVRHACHKGYTAESSLNSIIAAPRGVSWDYFIADGRNNKAVAVEAGYSTTSLDFLKYPPQELKNLGLIPTQEFLQRYENQQHQSGLMVRWNDYKYPEEFLQFNKDLFTYNKKTYNPADFEERGYISKTWQEKNCPAAYYFAPQRENKDDVLIMINHYVVPSMRLCAMNPGTVKVAAGNLDDIQWRYDELNNQVLENYGKIDFAKARELIDFLAPYRKFPEYYKHGPTSSDGKTNIVHGSVSVCDLTDCIMQSHFGFYADEWITTTLRNYVE